MHDASVLSQQNQSVKLKAHGTDFSSSIRMNFRYICLISLVLLIFAPKQSFYSKARFGLSIKLSPLAKAYFLGDKSELKNKTKKAHQNLNIQHLMTPSGLHLSALLFLLGFFTKRSSVFFGGLLVLLLLTYPLDGFSSLKRMIIFGLLKHNPIRKIETNHCFWLTFLLAFLLGMYFNNPLSFSLSFLFLGALLSTGFRLHSLLILFFSQAIISAWLNKDFYPLGSVYGLLLSLFSPFAFAGLILENIIGVQHFSNFWLGVVSLLDTHKGIALPNPVLILLPVYLMGTNKKMRSISLGLCLIFQTLELNPKFKTLSFKARAPRHYKEIKNIKGGIKTTYKNNMRCYSRLKMDEWSTHCH